MNDAGPPRRGRGSIGGNSYSTRYSNSSSNYYVRNDYDEEPHEMAELTSLGASNRRRGQLHTSTSYAPLLPQAGAEQDLGRYYDHGSRIWAALGIGFSIQCSLLLAGLGTFLWIRANPAKYNTGNPNGNNTVNVDVYPDNSQGILTYWDLGVAEWIPKLALNAIVTLCNVATGNVHGTTLKWALIEKGEPGFNANLRFFTAVGGLLSMNGYIANFLHAACLIISQASVSVILLPGPRHNQTLIPAMPLLAIAGALLIQSLLVLIAFIRTKVLTWSSSPLDVAKAAKLKGRIGLQAHRAMRSAADADVVSLDAIRPREKQPSAWESHKRVKFTVMLVWAMVFFALMWSYVLFALIASDFDRNFIHGGCKPERFLPPSSEVNVECSVWFTFNRWASVKGQLPNNAAIGFNLLLFVIAQGVLALGLHCCEMIVTLSRDEDVWRKATVGGAKHAGNQLYNFLSWKSIALLGFNPVLHWTMGNSLVINQGATAMYPLQIIWLTLGLLIVAILVTILARIHPKGSQPSAFGHLQTLVNLVDEDAPTIFWGYKGISWDGYHRAGTSRSPLPSLHPHTHHLFR